MLTKSEYSKIHSHIRKVKGKAPNCSNSDCKRKRDSRFEWALIKGKSYSYNPDDYISLCPSCHRKYDDNEIRRKNISNALMGRHLSDYHKKRLSRWGFKSEKKIDQYTLDGKFIKTWDSLSKVSKHFKISVSTIHKNLTGNSAHSAGFKWKYHGTAKPRTNSKRKVPRNPLVVSAK